MVAFDIDPAAVERNYRRVRADGETGILPPGWTSPTPRRARLAHRERQSLEQRGPADALLALALVHHWPSPQPAVERIAAFFARLARALVIEFLPKSDSRCSGCCPRAPTLPGLHPRGLRGRVPHAFRIEAVEPVSGSERLLYLLVPIGS